MEKYGRELRMGVDLKRKEKIKKAMEFAERMRGRSSISQGIGRDEETSR